MCLFIIQGWVENYPDEPCLVIPECLEEKVAAGDLGRKSEKGFYNLGRRQTWRPSCLSFRRPRVPKSHMEYRRALSNNVIQIFELCTPRKRSTLKHLNISTIPNKDVTTSLEANKDHRSLPLLFIRELRFALCSFPTGSNSGSSTTLKECS
jgi:3-hydroxyacyl-CoA dehydrogenase